MKNKLFYLLTLMLTAEYATAEIIPYLPEKIDLEKEVTSTDFQNLNFDNDFTLEFNALANQQIKLANSSLFGIDYICQEEGLYRFSNNSGVLYIYYNNKFKEKLPIYSLEFSSIYVESDNRESKTGIYSSMNLFSNPGFEDIVEGGEAANNQYIPAVWQSANFTTSTRSRVNTNYTDKLAGIESNGALMHHGYTDGDGMFFYQKIDNSLFEKNGKYRIQFRTWSHSNAYGSYIAKVGYSQNDNSVASYDWKQVSTAYDCKDIVFDFTLPQDFESQDIYFTVLRVGETIGHFDRMTMIKSLDDTPSGSGLFTENTLSIKFDETGAYSPLMILQTAEECKIQLRLLKTQPTRKGI